MKFDEYKFLVYSDFYRITDYQGVWKFIRLLFNHEGFSYTFWMRTCNYLKSKKLLKLLFYPIVKGIFRHYRYKYGIVIPFSTRIDSGFYIGHFGQIIVNGNSVIGKNCNISQGVTLGQANRGSKIGSPKIGNNVYIGPGVKIVGNIKIGNNVAIGANCVVTKDIPDNAVVVGIPGKVISYAGSTGYVNRTDYEPLEK
jgi:serine O-acetyltransferase